MSTASVDIIIAGQNKASNALNAAADGLKRMSQSARSAATAMKALVAVQVGSVLGKGFHSAASAVLGYANELRQAIDATAKLAQRTGMSVEALQSLSVAAGLSGVNDLTGALQKLSVNIGDAIADPKKQAAFTKLGLNFQELAVMAPEQQFRAIAAAINNIPGDAGRAAAAVDIFGKKGVELLPVFASNLAEVEARAEALGLVLGRNQTAAIEEMNDALDLVHQTFQGIIAQVTANLAPVVTAMAEEFLGFVEGFQGIGGATGGNALADAITNAFFDIADTLAAMFDRFLAGLGDFKSQITGVVDSFNAVAAVFTVISEGFQFAFNAFQVTGSLITEGIGRVIEYLGSWVSSAAEAFGRDMRIAAQESRQNTFRAMDQNVANIRRAMTNQNAPGAEGPGAAARAVAEARARFENRRDGDPAADARAEQQRQLAVMEQQRQASLTRAAQGFVDAMVAGAEAQIELTELLKERDKLEAERQERLAAPTPENQAVIDRFSSRGPAMEVQERTAAATEKLAELNEKIKAKQEEAVKAAQQTAANTANMFGIISR